MPDDDFTIPFWTRRFPHGWAWHWADAWVGLAEGVAGIATLGFWRPGWSYEFALNKCAFGVWSVRERRNQFDADGCGRPE